MVLGPPISQGNCYSHLRIRTLLCKLRCGSVFGPHTWVMLLGRKECKTDGVRDKAGRMGPMDGADPLGSGSGFPVPFITFPCSSHKQTMKPSTEGASLTTCLRLLCPRAFMPLFMCHLPSQPKPEAPVKFR